MGLFFLVCFLEIYSPKDLSMLSRKVWFINLKNDTNR